MPLPGANDLSLPSAREQVLALCEQLVASARRSPETPEHIRSASQCDLEGVFSALDSLVRTVPPHLANDILTDPKILELVPKVRRLRAIYESRSEKAQALALLSKADPSDALQHMLKTEFAGSAVYDRSLADRIGPSRENCLVVGSGPLPTTALMLHDVSDLRITCLDVEEESCLVSRQVFGAAGFPYPVEHIVEDVADRTDFGGYDVIFINALVGVSREEDGSSGKAAILDHAVLNISHDCLLVVRSGYGLGQIFYPEVSRHGPAGLSGDVILPARLGRSALVLFELSAIRRQAPLGSP